MSELKKGTFRPVYYLMGEEGYYTDRITDYIMENALNEFERDFNMTVYYGLDTDIDTIVTAAKRFPMMAERQVIVVKEAQLLKNIDSLLYYLQAPQPTTVLVFAHKNGSLDKRKKVAAELERSGVVLDSKKLRDDQLPAFINGYLREKGLVADAFPAPEHPLQEGCISYHLRTGKHNLTPYDWKCYMDFADRHGWRK